MSVGMGVASSHGASADMGPEIYEETRNKKSPKEQSALAWLDPGGMPGRVVSLRLTFALRNDAVPRVVFSIVAVPHYFHVSLHTTSCCS